MKQEMIVIIVFLISLGVIFAVQSLRREQAAREPKQQGNETEKVDEDYRY